MHLSTFWCTCQNTTRSQAKTSKNSIWANIHIYIYLYLKLHIAANVIHLCTLHIDVCIQWKNTDLNQKINTRLRCLTSYLLFCCCCRVFSRPYPMLFVCHVWAQFAWTIKLMRAHSYNGVYTFSMRITPKISRVNE